MAVAALALAFPGAAGAANYVVGTTNDTAPMPADCQDGVALSSCSLRAAITTANVDSAPDTITLQAGATYALSVGSDPAFGDNNLEGDLDVTRPVTIEGNGATIDASALANRERVLDVAMPTSGTVILRDLTATGGRAAPGSGTHGPGGGMNFFTSGGTVVLERVRVTGNRVLSTVSTQGGGVSAAGGTVEIRDSLIDGNVAEGGNPAGGIIASGGSLTLTNSTVTGNTGSLNGGGIVQFTGGQLHLRNSTVAGNSGNIRRNAGAVGTVINSIVADPSSGANCTLNGTTWSTSTGNVSSSADSAADGCAFGGTSLTGVNPLLAALGNNGGPTQTMALGAGSPAIDAGSVDTSLCPAADQRGVARPVDGNGDGTAACDAGAFEAPAPPPPAPPGGGGNTNPPGGDPPAPIGDLVAPGLTVRGASRQAPLRRRNSVVFKATSTEAGTLVAGGTFKIPGDRRTYRFESVTRVVTAGRTVTIKLLIPRRALSGVKRTLRRGRRINVSLTFTATDAAGNKATARRRIKLAAR